MFVGFYFQENAAATATAVLVPAVIGVRSRLLSGAVLVSALCMILATGSRSALAMCGVGVVYVARYRSAVQKRGEPVRIPLLWRALPVTALGASLLFFVFSSGDTLTGRGRIFVAMREQFTGASLLFGTGSEIMTRLDLAGGFVPVGEHGQAPHLLVQAGIPGLVLFCGALVSVALKERWNPLQVAALGMLVVVATQFLTEPGLQMNPRSLSFVVVLIAIGAMSGDTAPGDAAAPDGPVEAGREDPADRASPDAARTAVGGRGRGESHG